MNVNLETVDNTELGMRYQKRWLSPDDLALEYGFSKSTQAKMRMASNSSTIPFSKIGKFIRYDRVAIDTWLMNHQVQGKK